MVELLENDNQISNTYLQTLRELVTINERIEHDPTINLWRWNCYKHATEYYAVTLWQMIGNLEHAKVITAQLERYDGNDVAMIHDSIVDRSVNDSLGSRETKKRFSVVV